MQVELADSFSTQTKQDTEHNEEVSKKNFRIDFCCIF